MTTKKLYISDDREYFDVFRKDSFEAVNDTLYQGKFPYSEFAQPYLAEDEEYPWWEWTFPEPDWLDPDLPPGTIPDIEPNPCSMDGECQWAKIIGSDHITSCGRSHLYTQMHYWLGCSVAPWWAAFGSWELMEAPDGVDLVSSSPVMATIHVEDDAASGVATLCYYGPGCTSCMDIIIECGECCEEFSLSGSATVTAGNTWTGTISPACPTATCEISLDTGGNGLTCTLNEEGSEVTVETDAGMCGAFEVTIGDSVGGCDHTATASVVIEDGSGSWVYTGNIAWATCPSPCSWASCPGGSTSGPFRIGSAIYRERKYGDCVNLNGASYTAPYGEISGEEWTNHASAPTCLYDCTGGCLSDEGCYWKYSQLDVWTCP